MHAQRQRGRAVPRKRSPLPLFYTVFGLIVLLGGGLLIYQSTRSAAPELEDSATPARALAAPVGVTPEGFATKGRPDAPVTVIEYADFQCPACATFARLLEPTIDQRYVETGKVRMIFHDFPLPQHANAVPTSVAARCAGAQGKFWPMHDLLFTNQDAWERDPSIGARLTRYAAQLELDQAAFGQCVADPANTSAVQQAAVAASANGINATPTFAVNGALVDASNLEAAIEAALQEQAN